MKVSEVDSACLFECGLCEGCNNVQWEGHVSHDHMDEHFRYCHSFLFLVLISYSLTTTDPGFSLPRAEACLLCPLQVLQCSRIVLT